MTGSPAFDAPLQGYRYDPLLQHDVRGVSSAPSSALGTPTPSTQLLRPDSAASGSEKHANPLSLARWARRHRHNQSSNHNRHIQDEPYRTSMDREYGPADEKLRGRPPRSQPKKLRRSRSVAPQEQQPQPEAPAVPQMTLEEFEALPMAVRKKYFSTLERLRFAQESGLIDPISQHYNQISSLKCRKPRSGRTHPERPGGRGLRRDSASELRSITSTVWSADPSDRTEKESVALSHQSQLNALLSVADDEHLSPSRQSSRRDLSDQFDSLSPPHSPRARHSMDARVNYGPREGQNDDGQLSQSFFESFRWLDEEEDLDLRLFLDDYHANLREQTNPKTKQRPSFRRHMSINRKPFGRRNSVSSTTPRTKEAPAPAPSPSQGRAPSACVSAVPGHSRRKSRTLSLITPKHSQQMSVPAIDPAAAHYQDPEARMKLRMYLASPQKFDEAVAFGFPSADVLATEPNATEKPAQPSKKKSVTSEGSTVGTFLADDDDASLYSDGQSVADPESPRTPEPVENSRPSVQRHARYASAGVLGSRDTGRKTPDGLYAVQAPPAGREMTLRMTLTRPDLRSHEDEIYGWQQKQAQYQHTRRPTGLASLALENRGYGTLPRPSMDRLADMDHWADEAGNEKGVMRRIWNKVRRG